MTPPIAKPRTLAATSKYCHLKSFSMTHCFLKTILSLLIGLCSILAFSQPFKVRYIPATVFDGNKLMVNFGQLDNKSKTNSPTGQSVQVINSDNPLLYLPTNPNPGIRTWQDELNEKARGAVNNFYNMLAQFDQNLLSSAKNVSMMQKDSGFATKYPKMIKTYRKSLEGYQQIEPVTEELHTYFLTHTEIGLFGIESFAKGYLDKQRLGFEKGNKFFNQGQRIKKIATHRTKIINTAEKDFVASKKLTNDQWKVVNKARSDINFANNQIKRIMGDKKKLSDLTETARSEVLPFIGAIGMALRQTANTVDAYVSLLKNNAFHNGSIDVLKQFVETGIQEYIVNDKSAETSFKIAAEMAYYKFVFNFSSPPDYPLKDIAALPVKIKSIYDDLDNWNMLIEEPARLRAAVLRQQKEMDEAIQLNNRIIERARKQIDQILKSQTLNFLLRP